MNKSDFENFGIFATGFRCLMATWAIVQTVLAMDLKNRLIGQLHDLLSDIILYSMFAPFLVLTVSVSELADYKWKNTRQFERTVSTKPSLKIKTYMIISAIETMILIYYCGNLQYTMLTVSTEMEIILSASLVKYSTNTAWRIFWNNFQEHYSCCGSLNNTDWFQTAWVSPIVLSSVSEQKKSYTLNNGQFIIQAAPLSCCLPDSICDMFRDCEQPDPKIYYQKGCFSVIADTISLIAFTRYLFYAIIIIQIISTIVKYEGYKPTIPI